MAILFVAAESSELKPFSSALTGLRRLNWPIDYAYEGILEGRRMLLAANGAGPRLAQRAVEIAMRALTAAELSASKLEAVASIGYCGALDPSLKRNQIIIGERVISGSGESHDCAPVECSLPFVQGVVFSQDRVANSASEKAELRLSNASIVEMEAAGVASRIVRAAVPFACIKVVTDLAEESFGLDLNKLRTTEGRFARGKIGSYALTHPGLVPELLRLKRRSESAAQSLGEFLVSCRIHVESASSIAE